MGPPVLKGIPSQLARFIVDTTIVRTKKDVSSDTLMLSAPIGRGMKIVSMEINADSDIQLLKGIQFF